MTCFGPNVPSAWAKAKFLDRVRGGLAPSFCTVKYEGRQRFYIRGHLPIELRGHEEETFLWNVWVEVSEMAFAECEATMEDPARVDRPPLDGSLDTELPYPQQTAGLPVLVRHRPPGEVPYVYVTETPLHPLQREQQLGMDVHRLVELNHQLLG